MSSPDIEIYLQDTPANTVLLWLAARFPEGDALPKPAGKKQWRLQLKHAGNFIPALVIEDASPGFTSVWLDSSHTPWESDMACAREAHVHFNTEVRATPGSWKEGDDPDLWWRVNGDGEGLVHWHS
jgi:hypothetical protein